MMTERGIKHNTKKVRAIVEMQSPRSVKDVQKLIGQLATLSRFLSKSVEKSLPFCHILKKAEAFEWTKEYQKAFDDLKSYLSSFHVLSTAKKPTAYF